MPLSNRYNFCGVIAANSFDSYIDVAEQMRMEIDSMLRQRPLKKRKEFDKEATHSLKTLAKTLKDLKGVGRGKREDRDYVIIARELAFAYITAMRTISSYNGNKRNQNFLNGWHLDDQVEELVHARDDVK